MRAVAPGAGRPPVDGPWEGPPILTPRHVAPLLAARAEVGEATSGGDTGPAVRVETSLDLGLTRTTVTLTAAGVEIPASPQDTASLPDGGGAGLRVSWDELVALGGATTAGGNGRCFAVLPSGPREIQVFSPETNRRYSLLDTTGAPTMLISGVQMHRTTGQDPWGDTLAKVATLRPLVGRVLDTCTGLGYTAIATAQAPAVQEVVTVELDPGALEVARQNPWSRSLFGNRRIASRVGDSAEVLPDLPDGSFARIVHDPPVFSLAGDLYSGAFYRQLHRLLGRGGRLFHYIGNPAGGAGQRVTRGVVQRLREAGFSRVDARPEAFGVLAVK